MKRILSPLIRVLRHGLVAAALILSAQTLRAAIAGPEKLLPDDTLVMVTAPDFIKLRDLYKAAPQSKLWSDPALKPFRDHLTTKLEEELVKPLERELGIELHNYTSLPQGQVTFALTQTGAELNPGFLLLVDTKGQSSQLKTNLADLKRKWLDSGKSIKSEKVRDIEFSILRLADAELPSSLKKVLSSDDEESEEDGASTNDLSQSELVFGQFESLLIVGSSTKSVEKVAVHLTGGSAPALIDVAAFETSYTSTFREAPLYAWANVKTFLDLMVKQSAQQSEENPIEQMFDMQKILTSTGLSGLRTLGLSVQSSPEGFLTQIALNAPESTRQGLLKLFPSSGKDSMPPGFVPADATKFTRVRMDGQMAWATISRMLGEISPQMDGTINFLIEQVNESARQKDPNFDLRKSLFGSLGDDIIAYEKAAKGETVEELSSAPSIFLIGSPQPDQLAGGLKAVLSVMNPQASTPDERDFLGRKISSLPLPASPLGGGSGTGKLHYASSGGYLAITTDVLLLEELLRSSEGEQKKLREKAGLSEAIAKAGGGSTGWLSYENQAETMRAVIETLRKSGKDEEPEMLAPGIPAFTPDNPLKEWLDFSLLPPFDQIAKYFSFAIVTGNANAEGITFRYFEPVPPELRK